MKQHLTRASRQSGVMLIEALIALLIFAIGILGIVGLQAAATTASSDAKYRSEAALIANELIGQMWVSDRTQATLLAAFSSSPTAGPGYTAWAWVGTNTASPGTQTAPALGTVLERLPGAISNPPTVAIVQDSTTIVPTNVVTVTVFWQSPNDTTLHNYVAVAQIGG